ncbi:RTA1 like protein [Pyrenophora tritici-repentis]|nr:RTA1 like protein [Pyrenophora tritici-repentis]KAF7450253.1 RTA1 protein [Pyrenophora tritici-repentis]
MSSTDDSSAPEYVLWPYTPTIAAGATAAVIMFILFFTHAFLLFKNKTWFCIPFVIGALCEAVGYSARAAAHNNTDSKTPYIIQSTLILLAPILFAASIYMILGRLMRRTKSTDYSLVRVSWVTKVFVGGDVLCFLIQAGGAGLLISADTPGGFSLGENVILSGLILQILIFGFFVVVAGVWHSRLTRRPTAAATQLPWSRLIKVLIHDARHRSSASLAAVSPALQSRTALFMRPKEEHDATVA